MFLGKDQNGIGHRDGSRKSQIMIGLPGSWFIDHMKSNKWPQTKAKCRQSVCDVQSLWTHLLIHMVSTEVYIYWNTEDLKMNKIECIWNCVVKTKKKKSHILTSLTGSFNHDALHTVLPQHYLNQLHANAFQFTTVPFLNKLLLNYSNNNNIRYKYKI